MAKIATSAVKKIQYWKNKEKLQDCKNGYKICNGTMSERT